MPNQFKMNRTQTLEIPNETYKAIKKGAEIESEVKDKKISVNRLMKKATVKRAKRILEGKNVNEKN